MWVSAARGLYDGGRDGRAIDFDTRSVGEGWRLGRSEPHEIFICRPKFRLSDLTPADNEVMISPDLRDDDGDAAGGVHGVQRAGAGRAGHAAPGQHQHHHQQAGQQQGWQQTQT